MRQTGRPVCRFFYPVETPRRRDCRRGERLAHILQEELKNTKMKLPILLTLCLLAGVVNPARPQARRTRTQAEQTRSADRERAKREQAVADSLAHLKALRSLDRLDFALEADRLTLRRGRVVFVSSDTNFVTLSGDMATVQVAPFMGRRPQRYRRHHSGRTCLQHSGQNGQAGEYHLFHERIRAGDLRDAEHPVAGGKQPRVGFDRSQFQLRPDSVDRRAGSAGRIARVQGQRAVILRGESCRSRRRVGVCTAVSVEVRI